MRVGVPTEIKVHEYRVGLTPSAVREYVARGHQVMVQSGAGAGIMATDEAYKKAGARRSSGQPRKSSPRPIWSSR
jgi:alanine dehydrogenase